MGKLNNSALQLLTLLEFYAVFFGHCSHNLFFAVVACIIKHSTCVCTMLAAACVECVQHANRAYTHSQRYACTTFTPLR
jgi:hypothetical protein